MKKNTIVILLMFLFLLFSGSQALAKSNNPPKISSLIASVSSIKAQEKIKLTVVAKDADKDKLTYQWSQTNNSAEKGIFNGSGASVYWTAPRVSEEKRIVLQVKVLDSKKATATKIITVTVAPKPLTQLYEELKSSVVSIKTDKGFLGTGFVYSKNGLIATNYHVIKGAKKVEVTFSSGKTYVAGALMYQDFFSDWAIFSINASDLKPLVMQKIAPKIGEEVFTIGNPQGLGWSMSSGIISDNARDLFGEKYLQTTTPVNPGNSGGPLFNRKGEVLGVVTLKLNNNENLNFALPISKLTTSADDLVDEPFEKYFSEDAISTRLDDIADEFNDDADFTKLGISGLENEKVTYANGTWEDENKELVFGLEVQVTYDVFLKIMKAHQESDKFNEDFYVRYGSLTNSLFNYAGSDSFYLYFTVVDNLDTPPSSQFIPPNAVVPENGKYKVYYNFYSFATDSNGSLEYWFTDK